MLNRILNYEIGADKTPRLNAGIRSLPLAVLQHVSDQQQRIGLTTTRSTTTSND